MSITKHANLPLPPLVEKYFGEYLKQLAATRSQRQTSEYFTRYIDFPDRLEERLQRIEALQLTPLIIAEVDQISKSDELDRRLTDAWAEIRTVDQLHTEGFSDIQKCRQTVDFTANCMEQTRAFQVTRISSKLEELIRKGIEKFYNRQPKGQYAAKNDVFGSLNEILD